MSVSIINMLMCRYKRTENIHSYKHIRKQKY